MPGMSVTLKMANVWRVLRDVNLEAIRASAEARFILPVVADQADDAAGVRALLGPDDGRVPHPWLVPVRAADGMPVLPQRPLLSILVTRSAALTPALETVRDTLRRADIGVITAVVDASAPEGAPAPDELARVFAPSIDSRLVRDLGSALVRAAGPEWRLALARQLPPLRTAVINAIVEETAQANASYALATGFAEAVPVLTAPMNLGDMIVLTKNQLVMSYRVALACGLEGDPRRLMPEILGVLGGGLLFRQLARQLVGFIPVLGLVPKVAIAYGGTYAIGRAIAGWAQEGRAVSAETVQRFSREGLERGRELARSLVDRARPATRGRRRWDALRHHVPDLRRGH
jgi:uncharacterized protein (DUF697 family)